ncbi:MAG TPA: ATP-binding protein [Gaiellaceae bacterium]|nr:ATP-binding protein [Gaiellaceae bacterium]
MSRLPIRVRLALAFALVMALVFAAVGAILYIRLGDALDERIGDTLEARTTVLAATFDVTSPASAGEEGLAQVLERDGSIVAGAGAAERQSPLASTQLERARLGSITIDTELDGTSYRALATPVDERIVVVAEPLDDRDEALDGLLAQLLVVLPVALLVSSVVGYLVAGAALRPVEAMRRRAAEISVDTPERRLPLPPADDEISRLGATLNEMLSRLDAGIARERRFVADASHELRTPLAALRTELELAARRPRSVAELDAAVRSAREEVERLVRLADDLLVLARADDGQLAIRPEELPVRELLEAVARRRAADAQRSGRAIEVSTTDELVLVGDRGRLEQALESLVDNALVHGSGTVQMSARVDDGRVLLVVSDEGSGFPASFVPHAFERFSRADASRSGGGVGLGLAIVDAIARAHGGAAHVDETGAANVRLELPSRLNGDDAVGRDSGGVR